MPNPQHGSGLPEGRFEGRNEGASQDKSLAAKSTHVDGPLVKEASGILSGRCSWAWEMTW